MPMRAAFALVVTVVGLFFLFTFKTPDVAVGRPAIVIPSPLAGPAGTPIAGSPSPTSTTTSSSTVTATAAPAGLRDGLYTGQDFPNEFGDVQVSVRLAGGRITDVQAVQLPSDRARSAYISQQAGPMLRDQVLQAQSAQIDGISGATYTSASYAQSVQSALDQAHA